MLLGNGSPLLKCPVRFMAGSAASVEPQLRNNWNRPGSNRNQQYRDRRNTDEVYAVTPGVYPPYTWLLPQRNGAMSSHDNTVFGITCTGTLYGGITATSINWTIGISFPPTTDAELVATVPAGGAPATFEIATNEPLLTASLSAAGTGTFGFTVADALLGALGGMIGTGTFGFSGTLTSHAIGIMEGTTEDPSVVTPASVAAAVWASSLEGTYTAEEIMKILAAIMAGDGADLEGLHPEFTAMDGSKTRVTSTYSGGTRTITSLDVT